VKRRALSTAAFAVLSLAAACAGLGVGDEDALPALIDVDGGTLSVEIGTGVVRYEPLSDGPAVDVISGRQGGYHVWTSVRIRDLDLDHVRIDLSTRFEDDGKLAGPTSAVSAPLEAVDGAHEHAGMTSFIDDPTAVRGRRLLLRAEVTSDDGRRGADQRVVVAR
jgi:hypothetical protein